MIKAGFVLINCLRDYSHNVISELKYIPGVKRIHSVVGTYEIIVEVEAKTTKEFQEVISKIRRIPNVDSTTTLRAEDSSEKDLETVPVSF